MAGGSSGDVGEAVDHQLGLLVGLGVTRDRPQEVARAFVRLSFMATALPTKA